MLSNCRKEHKIELKAADVYYGERQVLNGVDLRVADGEFLIVLGPNGCGKTTMIKTVSGLLAPKKGGVLLDGKDIHRLSRREIARKIAVVVQDGSADFDFTAGEMVRMGRNPYLKRLQTEDYNDRRIVKAAMERTNTLHLRDRYITDISGGERQSVMIAQALAQEPQILMLDEPTQHLDLARQLEIMELITGMNRRGMTVIGVFHDINLAAKYAKSIALMVEGRIAAVGPPAEVITEERIKEVFGVCARIEMNRTTGRPRIIDMHPEPVGRPAAAR